MDRVFLTVLNMSVSASLCILAVLAVRILIRRAPKMLSYLLWAVVFIRLVCPVLPEAGFGLIPDIKLGENRLSKMEYVHEPGEVGEVVHGTEEKARDHFAAGVDSNSKPDKVEMIEQEDDVAIYVYPSERVTKTFGRIFGLERFLPAISWIWILGVLWLILFAGIRYWIFMQGIEKREVTTPFVAGILHPVVYLPKGLGQMQEQMVLEHENIHIRRHDYLVKPIAFLVCCVHWFNPLVWLSFFLMEKDMETSCDEAVLRKIGYDRRKDYAGVLLELAQNLTGNVGYPIAFGENSVKSRIKEVVRMKKTGVGVGITAVAVIFLSAVLLLVNRPAVMQGTEKGLDTEELAETGGTVESVEVMVPEQLNKSEGSDVDAGGASGTEKGEGADVDAGDASDAEKTEEPEKLVGEEEAGANANSASGEKEAFSLPDVKEYFLISSEDIPEEERTYLSSFESGGRETIMNYNPDRVRDQFEVLDLPQAEESFTDVEVLFSYPVEADRISDVYGSRIHPVNGDLRFHLGVDFAAQAGAPVVAAADGMVVRTGFDADCGNYMILLHEDGSATYYFHCQDILAKEGQQVKGGEQIATVGNTGKSTGPHLHFGVSKNGVYVKPEFVEEN